MIEANQWARHLREEMHTSIEKDPQIDTGFLKRSEAAFRKAQLDAISQCLRIAQRAMNAAQRRHRDALGVVVDQLADFALDVKQRVTPKVGDG